MQVFAIAGPQARKTAAESKEEIRLAKQNALDALEQTYGDDESTNEERYMHARQAQPHPPTFGRRSKLLTRPLAVLCCPQLRHDRRHGDKDHQQRAGAPLLLLRCTRGVGYDRAHTTHAALLSADHHQAAAYPV